MPLIDDTTVLATGSTTRRSLEARHAEIFNVRDFGALGNGSTDDRATIQAAIDAALVIDTSNTHSYGVIFFPAGNYVLNGSLTFNVVSSNSIIFRGVGLKSIIRGNFAGFLLDATCGYNPSMCVIELLSFVNVSINTASGCIRWMAGHGIMIRDCMIQGYVGAFLDSFGAHITNCQLPGTGAGGVQLGSMGIRSGGGYISGCDILGFHHGIAIKSFAHVFGCRFENNGNGITVGIEAWASSVVAEACSFEANDCGIWFWVGYDSTVNSCGVHGHAACPYSGYGGGSTAGPIEGADPEDPLTMWSTYGYRLNASGGRNTFISNTTIGQFNEAAISIADGAVGDGAAGTGTWIGSYLRNDGTSLTGSTELWQIGGANNGGYKFINCFPPPDPVFVFADLPTTAITGRAKGVKYFITNGGAQAIGAVVSVGGGSTFMEVMWNGTEWTRCA